MNTSDLLDPIIAGFSTQLEATVMGHAVEAYLQGSAQMVEWGRTATTDLPIYYEGPPMREAIAYARKHSAQLVTRMNQETKDRLAQAVATAIDEKAGVDGLARAIRGAFDDMSKSRAQTIARTETCDSLEQAFMDRAKDLGITGKEWIVAPQGDYPCEECEANGHEGPVKLDHVFSSGHERPPAHPNCVCALAPVMLPEKERSQVSRRAPRVKAVPKSPEATLPAGVTLRSTPYLGNTSMARGGNFFLVDAKTGAELAHANAAFEPKAVEYAFSGSIPAKTMVIDSIEVLSQARRNQGLGSALLTHVENEARKAGMVRARATSVMYDAEGFWTKMGYTHTGQGRIWEKQL